RGRRDRVPSFTSVTTSPACNGPSPPGDGRLRLPSWPPRSELIHLIHLLHLLWQPLFDPMRSWVDWALLGAVVVIFPPLFVASGNPDQDVQRRTLWATIVLATLVTPFNVGAAVLFVYAAVMAAYLYGRQALRWHFG